MSQQNQVRHKLKTTNHCFQRAQDDTGLAQLSWIIVYVRLNATLFFNPLLVSSYKE